MFGLFRRKSTNTAPSTEPVKSPSSPVQSFDRSLVVPLVKAVVGENEGGEVIELPPDDSPISIPLVAELIVMYALDYPDRFEFITKRHLQENSLNQEELHTLALSNLPNRVPRIEMHGESPRYMITAGGNFEATLLLLDGLWDQLAELLPGKPMAVVPARDLLFVSGSEYEGAGQFLAQVASKELEEKRYALSQCVLIREGSKWHAYRAAS